MTWEAFFILLGISVAFSVGMMVGYALGETHEVLRRGRD